MVKKDICKMLDALALRYGRGVYPGRSSDGLKPRWPADPFHVLVATILSQRTRDENTRKTSDSLFQEYDSIEELAEADVHLVAELIKSAGFPDQKSVAIVKCCQIIRDQYSSVIPSETAELIKLPMVGRKTAACVRSYAMNIPSVCVDTHVHRLSNLIGLVRTRNSEETEYELMRITPKKRWSDINRYFVRHGQVMCTSRRHECEECPIKDMCDSCSVHCSDKVRELLWGVSEERIS